MSPHASASQPMDGEPIAGCGRWWGGPAPPVATPTSTDVMNQLCRVCGEPAAGFHFGAFTCEGCKSFFGRTYNNLSSISECKNNGCCVINKKNRTSCKACRLRKCLMVGMSKSGSRYGRRSNWFKIHCLLQEQQQQHTQQQQQQQQKGNKEWETHSQSHYKPIETNNNVPTKRQLEFRQAAVQPSFSPTNASAFWAARSSMIHPASMPSLPLPFLGSSFYPPRNFLIPFMPTSFSIPPAPLDSPASPKSPMSSTSTSCSSSVPEMPEEECGVRVRTLGPVQEQPIDLSVTGRCAVIEEAGETSGDSASEGEEVGEGRKRTGTPLDLTRRA